MRNYLLSHQQVFVPGLGRFYAVANTAQLFDNKSAIIPPKVKYQFEDSNSNDVSFVEYVADIFGTSFHKAEKKINNFTQHVLNNLLNFKTADIPYLGTLTVSEDKHIAYVADDELLKIATAYLPILSIPPVQRSMDHKKEVIKESLDNNKSYQSDFAKPIEIIDHSVVSGNKILDIALSLFLILMLIVGMKSCFGLYQDNQLRNKGFKANTTIDTVAGAESFDTLNSTTKVMEQTSSLDDSENEKWNSKNSNALDSGHSDTETNIVKVEEQESKEVKQEVVFGSEDVTLPSSGKCIIILGSYSSKINVDNMSKRIASQGHILYTEALDNGLTRVGVEFDCVNVILENYIKKIRATYGNDAWYLVPNVVIY